MSNNDNSLLDFLKRKSLFSYSPAKNSKRSRSGSRQSHKFSNISAKDQNHNDFEGLNQKIANINMSHYEYSPQRQQRFVGHFSRQPQNFQHQYENRYANPLYNSRQFSSSKQRSDLSQRFQQKSSKFWTGLSSYGQNFQSARLESIHCLQNLTGKISIQIDSIQSKMENFNSRMFRMLNNQFKSIQERIYKAVETSFKESQKWIRQYMKQQENLLAGALIKAKSSLQKELLQISSMKDQLYTPNWRQVAGQILSTELQKKIQQNINQVKLLNPDHWQLQNFGETHMKIIQNQIKLIFHLKL